MASRRANCGVKSRKTSVFTHLRLLLGLFSFRFQTRSSVENVVETAAPRGDRRARFAGVDAGLKKSYPCTVLKINGLLFHGGHLHFLSCPLRRERALFTFAQICSRRVTKEYSSLCSYSSGGVNTGVTTQYQKDHGFALLGALPEPLLTC